MFFLSQYNQDEMLELILKNNDVFAFLNYYYIEETTTQEFQEYMRKECGNGRTEREVLADYYAAWIPWEEQNEKLIRKITELATAS